MTKSLGHIGILAFDNWPQISFNPWIWVMDRRTTVMPPDIWNRDISTAGGTHCSYFRCSWLETHRYNTMPLTFDPRLYSNVSSVFSPKSTVTHVNMFTARAVGSASSYSNLWQTALSATFASGLICRCTQNSWVFECFPFTAIVFHLHLFNFSAVIFHLSHHTTLYTPPLCLPNILSPSFLLVS